MILVLFVASFFLLFYISVRFMLLLAMYKILSPHSVPVMDVVKIRFDLVSCVNWFI